MAKAAELKKAAERSARELLFGSQVFPVIRNAYQVIFDRKKFESRKRNLDFYAQFVSPDDLIFDVGANVGDYSDLFLALGARVVAIEPNPAGCERLEMVGRRRGNLVVENCAAGDSEGLAPLRVNSDSGLSTLSSEWYETVQKSPVHGRKLWAGTINVRVTTLDHLAVKYGEPRFVKIDVEGFEDRVLSGMSFRPHALSFEFHFQLLDLATSCLRNMAQRGGYRFNYTLGMGFSFQLSDWTSCDELEKTLASASPREEFGDIICITR